MANTELGFAITYMTPTAITKTNPVRVTVVANGLVNGQYVRATRFYPLPAIDDTGMYQLNNQQYVVGNVTVDTFDLYDQYGNPIDGTDFVTFIDSGVAQINLVGESLFTQNLNTMST
jgi:hypothetical protein